MRRDNTPIPAGFAITKCPPRVAVGAHKPRMSGGYKGAQSTKNIYAQANRKALLAYAYKGINS